MPDGFAGGQREQRSASSRGLAQGPNGEIYVTDDRGGRVGKVTYAPP
jgi:glucose/arabinose dehydrogenase